jgi:hypothetical protein
MVDAKRRDEWNHTASLMALMVNINRDPKKGRAVKPDDFHPFSGKQKSGGKGIPLTKSALHALVAGMKKRKGKA